VWCNRELLFKYIRPDEFRCVDLEKPITLDKTYDLVISLEVAEHLSESSAEVLVESLVKAGKVILFSAAIPKQGGFNHINEQWPSYWEDKFQKFAYRFHDIIRWDIWNREDIEVWYKQNIFIVAHESVTFPSCRNKSATAIYSVVHPDMFERKLGGEAGILFCIKLLMRAIIVKAGKVRRKLLSVSWGQSRQ
jgi:hypothetical protein